MDTPFVSVVIPTLNREIILTQTLEYLKSQIYKNFEIVIIDQSDIVSNKFKEYIKSYNNCELIYVKIKEKGLPNARNVGIGHSNGEFLLFLDDDIKPSNNIIHYHIKAHIENDVCGVCGPIIEGKQHGFIRKSRKIGTINIFGRTNQNRMWPHKITVDSAFGGNMSFKREDLNRSNLRFDKNFIGNAQMEESDFSYRLRKFTKKSILYEPKASLLHFPQPSGNFGLLLSNQEKYYYTYFHNFTLFSLKNLPRWQLLFSIPFHFLIAVKRGLIIKKSTHSFIQMVLGFKVGYDCYKKNYY